MKKYLILVMFLVLGLGLSGSNPLYANSGLVTEPITSGLWHEVEFDEETNTNKAYIHLKFYVDGNLITTDASTHKTRFNKDSSFDKGKKSSTRVINIPSGYNDFKIDIFMSGIYADTKVFDNISRVRIELYDDFLNNSKFRIYDDITNNVLYTTNSNFNDTVILYWESDYIDSPSYEDDTYLYVKNNYDLLPDLKNKFIRIDKLDLIDNASKTYKMYFSHSNEAYAFDVSIPSEIDMINIYDNNNKINISISSNDKNEKLLYIQPDKDLPPYPDRNGTLDKPSVLHVGFITLNLTTKKYEVIMPLKMQAIVNKESNRNAFAYMFFNIPIEKIYSMELKYSYRFNYLFKSSDYETVTKVFLHDEKSEVKPPFWLLPTWWYYVALDKSNLLNISQIQKIGKSNIPDKVLNQYKNDFQGDVNNLNNLGLYKVHLGQFKDFRSTSYDVHEDVVLLNILYLYEGVVYDVPYDKIEQDWKTPPQNEPPLSNFFKLNFHDFFKFNNVNDIASFFTHLVSFWLESIIFFGVSFLFIKMILSIFRKKRHYYNRW